MLMTGGLRIYQVMNIKIGSSRKKGDCTKKQSQETTWTEYVRKREHIICGRSTYGESYYFIMHQETYKNPNSI